MASPEERERIMAEYLAQQNDDEEGDDDEFDDRAIDDDDDDDDDEADFEPGGDDEDEEEDEEDGQDDDELPLLQGNLTYDVQKCQLSYQGVIIMGNNGDAGDNTFMLSSALPLHFDFQQPTRSEPVTIAEPSKFHSFPQSARIIDMSGHLGSDKIKDHLQFTISIPTLLKRGYDDDDDDDNDGAGKKLASAINSKHNLALKGGDYDDDKATGGSNHRSKSSSKHQGKGDDSFVVHAFGTLESGQGFHFQGQFSDSSPKAMTQDDCEHPDDCVPLVCQLRYDDEDGEDLDSKLATPATVARAPPVAAAAAAKRQYDDDDDDDGEEDEADEGIDYDELIELHKEAGTPIDQVLKRRRRYDPQPAPQEGEEGIKKEDDDEDDYDYKEGIQSSSKPPSKRTKRQQDFDAAPDDDDDVGF